MMNKEGIMKKNLMIIVVLIVSLMPWTLAAAGPRKIIVRSPDSLDQNADAGTLKVAQNLRFPPSLPSSPPPSYPATVAPLPPIPQPAGPTTAPPQIVTPPKNITEPGITNPRTGEFYPGALGGVTNPRTGVFMPKVEGGYLNPETGEVIPKK
jgi:hypothetical protein